MRYYLPFPHQGQASLSNRSEQVTFGGALEKSTRSVLIVDDYEPWRRFMLSTIQKWPGLQILGEAADGLEAVLKSQQLRPDLIVLDIGLPKINGIEVARQIRQHLPNATILFCSDNRSPDIAEEALRTGVGYLVKSDAASDLLPAVASAIGGRRFVSRTLAGHTFGDSSESGPVRCRRHAVEFYRDDAHLLDEIATLFEGSYAEGLSVAAIVTSSHRSGLEKRLAGQNIDVSDATRRGRLCMFDANRALSEIMEPAGLNRERALSELGNILGKLKAATAATNCETVVFGEMAPMLWAQKQYDAAIRLEALWNEVAPADFSIYCAYPMQTPGDGQTVLHYAEICAQHSHVVPALADVGRPPSPGA